MDIVVEMNNDEVREGLETLIVEISDPTQTAQITNNRISAEIKDDDPSVPELSIERVSYDLSEGETIALDDIELDYFDPNAFFSINSQLPNASGSTLLTSGGVELSENAYVSAFDFKTDVLRNVSFVAEGLVKMSQRLQQFSLYQLPKRMPTLRQVGVNLRQKLMWILLFTEHQFWILKV